MPVIGALAAGRVADWIGRRLTVLITALVFIVGVLLAAFTPTYPMLLVARVIIGLAVGSASMVVPLYIGEIVPPRLRGQAWSARDDELLCLLGRLPPAKRQPNLLFGVLRFLGGPQMTGAMPWSDHAKPPSVRYL